MKTKLSNTSVQMYLESSMKYKLHYIDKIRPIQTKSAFIFGRALDNAFNSLLKERDLDKALRIFRYRMSNAIINGKRVKVEESDLVKYTNNDLDQELIDYCNITPKNKPWTSLCLKGELIVRAYFSEVLPNIKEVLSIQKRISLKNEVDDEIGGLLDAVVIWEDGKTYLIDNKSSTVKYKPESVRESNQLALYHYIEKDNIKLDGAGFIVLDKNIKKNKVKTCTKCGFVSTESHHTCNAIVNNKRCKGEWSVEMTPSVKVDYIFNEIKCEDEERVIEDFDKVNTGIANGVFECKGDSCYTKFGPCPYQSFCRTGSMEGLVKLPERKKK